MKTMEISSYDLSDELCFDVPNISNWLNGKYEPDKRSKEDIYEYAYKNGIRINKAHEEPFLNMAKRDGFTILYHGSKYGIDGDIDLKHSKSNNDFSNGFYLGETLNQSQLFVSEYKNSHIYAFALFTKGLKIVKYNTDLDWLLTIAFNRGRLKEYSNSKKLKEIIEKSKKADVIIAPIADNRMFDIINEFVEGMITDEACIYALAALDLGKQFVLKTEKAVNKLALIREFYVCTSEKDEIIKDRNKLSKDRIEAIKNFRSKNRHGKYIEDIL